MTKNWHFFVPRLLIKFKRRYDVEIRLGVAMRVRVGQSAPVPSLPAGYRYESMNSPNLKEVIQFFNEEAEFPTQWTEPIFAREALSGAVPGGAIMIADVDGNPVAFGALWRDSVPRYGRIMYVLVARQHRRKQLGARIIRELLAIAAENNFDCVVLMTDSCRPHAIRLYRSFGFSVLTRHQRAFLWLKGSFSQKLLPHIRQMKRRF